jgi:hypothetical protein
VSLSPPTLDHPYDWRFLAVIVRGRDELTQLGDRSDASELMFIILRPDPPPPPIFSGLGSGPDWVLSSLDLVTECGVRSRVCYLELRTVTPISGPVRNAPAQRRTRLALR